MTRGQIRTLIRQRVRDTASRRWPDDSVIDADINLAAQNVAAQLSDDPRYLSLRNTYSFAPSTATEYPLLGVTDYRSSYRLVEADGSQGREIAENEEEFRQSKWPAGRDEDGRLVYQVRWHPNEMAFVEISGSPTGGTWKLTFDSVETSALNHNATAAQVQAALEAHAEIGSGNVTVTGSASDGYTVEFGGDMAGHDLPALTASSVSLTPSGSVTVNNYQWSLIFVEAPGTSGDITFVYRREIPDIPTGADGDKRRFHGIPVLFDQLIAQEVVVQMLGHDASGTAGFALSFWQYVQGVVMTGRGTISDSYRIKG